MVTALDRSPTDALHIAQDLLSCAQVNHHWNNVASLNELWRPLCAREWSLPPSEASATAASSSSTTEPSTSSTLSTSARQDSTVKQRAYAPGALKQYYLECSRRWWRYRGIYPALRHAWGVVEERLAANPALPISLEPGVDEEAIEAFETTHKLQYVGSHRYCRCCRHHRTSLTTCNGVRLPEDFRCSLRIHSGQTLIDPLCGVFGGYSFYDHYVSMILLPFRQLQVITRMTRCCKCPVLFDSIAHSLSHSHSFVRSLVLPIGRGIRTLIFCFSAGEQRKCYYCQSEPGGDRILPAVYESSPSETPLLVASSFSTLLRVYAQRLASGYYRIHPYVHARRIIQRADRCATIGNAMMLLSYLLTSLAL